jgi:predicted transposase/invertase (TIGR01784 family)
MPALLSPKQDLVFKLLFGDERHLDIPAPFLRAVLSLPDDDLAEISLLSPMLPTEFPADKLGILDVQVRTRSGRRIDVEIQVEPRGSLCPRVLFYAARMITAQVGEGDAYVKIKPAVVILITDFDLLGEKKDRRYHHRYRLYDPSAGLEFTDLLEVDTLELPKLPEHTDGTKLWDWLEFMRTQDEEELDMLSARNPDVGKAVTRLKELSADEKVRALHEAYEKARRDQKWFEQSAREEGRGEGREEGERNAQLAIARKALAENLSIETIQTITGLMREEIQSLRAH